MHTLTTRPPTESERRVIVGQSKPDLASIGCLALFFGIFPVFLLGKVGAWIFRSQSQQHANFGQWFGWTVGVLIFCWSLVLFTRYERRRMLRSRQDLANQVVQEIAVSGARVFEIGLINDDEPILAFDIGDQKILFLQGQWLRDSGTYGARRQEGDPEPAFLNGLPEPHSFPSSAFTLTRLPQTGRVLSIRVEGHYQPPVKTVEALKREYHFRDSELFDGSLEDLAGILAKAHADHF